MARSKKRPPIRPLTLELRCPVTSECLGPLRALVHSLARNVGFSEEKASEIELAVDEACANCIDHAYEEHAVESACFHLRLHIEKDFVEISVVDHGKGCPELPASGYSPDEFHQRRYAGGLGTYIMRRFMDEIHIESESPSGTSIRMRKYLH